MGKSINLHGNGDDGWFKIIAAITKIARMLISQNETISFHPYPVICRPDRKAEPGSFLPSFSRHLEGIKRDNKTGTVPISSFRTAAPFGLLPLESSHCASHDGFQARARCVRKTATFPSGTPRVPSSTLCSISKYRARLPSFASFSFSFSARLELRARSLTPSPFSPRATSPLFFPRSVAFSSPIATPFAQRRCSMGRCVRLNIDYARFETRVMRGEGRPARVSAARSLQREGGKNS